MRVLIADDDPVTRRLLEAMLTRWGYEVVFTKDGSQALETLEKEDSPPLTILDWAMPVMDGIQVCRQLRENSESPLPYI